MRAYEVAIIGAGPAGSALAARLAALGRRVVLVERDSFPRDKLCGEFLSTETFRCLETLGCAEAFLALGPAVMEQGRLMTANGATLDLRLPGPAYGLSRKKLDAFMVDFARQQGAEIFDGVEVRAIEAGPGKPGKPGTGKRLVLRGHDKGHDNRSTIEADVVVAAYGRRTALDRKLARAFFSRRSNLVAFKKHHRFRRGEGHELRGCVELYAFDGGYCGVSYVEEDLVNLCTMFDTTRVGRPKSAGADDLRRFLTTLHRGLARRLETLEPDLNSCGIPGDAALAVAQIPLVSKKPAEGALLFVGDAAGMIAPLAGNGQAMAIESALALADLLDTHLPHCPAAAWARLWHARYSRRLLLGRWLHRALIAPAVATPAIGILNHWPAATRTLVATTRSGR